MKITHRDRRLIQAPIALVYAVLADPLNWPGFIRKIKSIRGNAEWFGGVVTGKRGDRDFSGQLSVLEDQRCLLAEIKVEDNRALSFSVEYRLEELALGTAVTEIIRFGGELPFWGWLLIKVISRFGRNVEPSNLEMLESFAQRVVAQTEASQASAPGDGLAAQASPGNDCLPVKRAA